MPLLLPFWLSFPEGICICSCFSGCHSRRESAFALAFAFPWALAPGPLAPHSLPSTSVPSSSIASTTCESVAGRPSRTLSAPSEFWLPAGAVMSIFCSSACFAIAFSSCFHSKMPLSSANGAFYPSPGKAPEGRCCTSGYLPPSTHGFTPLGNWLLGWHK